MESCKPILTPVQERLNLQKDGARKLVNPTLLKQLVELVGYIDNGWGDDVERAKSILGYAFHIGSGAISWSSKKQQVVALLSTKPKYNAAPNCATQAVWLRQLLGVLHHEQKSPTTIYCDNNSVIALAKNPIFHGMTKHIHVKFHYICDFLNDKVVEVQYCPIGEQIAHIFTKGPKTYVFMKLKKMMGMESYDEFDLREAVGS
ncbi:PREDICTED: Retrovirus-related Pol poly from transposon [Prunus dulcis]|uniref:PREDICTED: Retrovirus-related Pol poly from transposon n=1 Tax=Prunus dulcis TaxID=3755 RepID=A0A5E4EX32_PRUDU|nr:PREDICTED: Retrovirus-related Pol poly from transposon [Prunus dulcis]